MKSYYLVALIALKPPYFKVQIVNFIQNVFNFNLLIYHFSLKLTHEYHFIFIIVVEHYFTNSHIELLFHLVFEQ